MPRCRGRDIEEASISQLQQWLDGGAFSSWDLTSCYLTRIERLNNRLRLVKYCTITAGACLLTPGPPILQSRD